MYFNRRFARRNAVRDLLRLFRGKGRSLKLPSIFREIFRTFEGNENFSVDRFRSEEQKGHFHCDKLK